MKKNVVLTLLAVSFAVPASVFAAATTPTPPAAKGFFANRADDLRNAYQWVNGDADVAAGKTQGVIPQGYDKWEGFVNDSCTTVASWNKSGTAFFKKHRNVFGGAALGVATAAVLHRILMNSCPAYREFVEANITRKTHRKVSVGTQTESVR